MSTPGSEGSPAEWLDTRQAALLKGVSQRAINRAIQEGRLAASRIGHRYVIHPSDLQAWTPDLSKRRRPRQE